MYLFGAPAGLPFHPAKGHPLHEVFCRNGYTRMIGTLATMVIVARIEVGVT